MNNSARHFDDSKNLSSVMNLKYSRDVSFPDIPFGEFNYNKTFKISKAKSPFRDLG